MKALTILGLCLESPKPSLLAGLQTLSGRFAAVRMFVCAPRGVIVDGAEMVPEPKRREPLKPYPKMALLRNAVLKHWRAGGAPGDVVLWVDMDIAGFSDWRGLDRLLAGDDSWDAVATMGVHEWQPVRDSHPGPVFGGFPDGVERCYFDFTAYESITNTRHLPRRTTEQAARKAGKVPDYCPVSREPVPVSLDRWTECHSAFGPACFYRAASLDGLWYDPQTRQCEHHDLHAAMRRAGHNRLFVANDLVAHYDRLPAARTTE